MECPHCLEEMIYIANSNWTCHSCRAHVIDCAYEGLHYFSNGVVHRKDGLRCRVVITI